MTASALGAVAAGHTLSSPDGHITVTFDNKDAVPYYSVDVDGSPLINPSRLGIVSEEWSQPKSKVRVARSATDYVWHQPWGENKEVREHYNEMAVTLSARASQLTLRFRAFDDRRAHRV